MASAVVHLARNNQGRDIVVGDIHGVYSSLEAELRRISFDPAADRLICVGELVDRGPESEMLSRWLQEPWFHCVLGNHDVSLLLSTRDQLPAWVPDESRACAFGLMCQEHDWWRRLDDLHQDAIVGALSQLPRAIPDLAHVFHGRNLTRDWTIWRLANRFFIETGGWLWAARPEIEAWMSNPSHWTLVDARYPGIPL